MSDNIRTSLYGAEYDVPAGVARQRGAADAGASRRKALREWRHRRSRYLGARRRRAGDLLGVAATGAYCYSMSSRYNMLGRPAVVAVRDGHARLILRRETVDDLMSLEVRCTMSEPEKPVGVAVSGTGQRRERGRPDHRAERARPRCPHRRAAGAARHRRPPGGRRSWRAGRPADRRRRRTGVARRRRHRRRADGARRTCAQGDPRRRSSTASRWSPPTRRCWPSPPVNWRRPPRTPKSTCTSRPRSPVRSR